MVRSLVWLVVVAVAGFGGLRFAEAVATVDVGLVRLEGQLTVPESRQVQEVVDTVLSRPGPHGARDVAAAIESIGWVRQVMVRLRWPDTLHVAVVRDTLAAGWGDDAYLTTGGDVVPVPSDSGVGPDSDLPILSGSLSDGAEAMRIYNLLNAQARAIGLRIARLEEDGVGNWSVAFADGMEVVLGSTALRERFDRFLVVYAKELADSSERVVRVDARYQTGVAVQWESEN
ncbi:MAG: cell division protein FtsQ/DivIB [Gammaproteobacteria bacterium]|nr:cell division protein FtsQ/DivIB [Gammaproteobacteria bacterium]MDE0444897.1 cell division protein FtsQ/DivIB [Gammaproteobacteria bacterium]